MKTVTVSSRGRVAIPKPIRKAMNLTAGTRLTLRVRGGEIVLSKDPAWKRLRGACAGRDVMSVFSAFRKQELELEEPHS